MAPFSLFWRHCPDFCLQVIPMDCWAGCSLGMIAKPLDAFGLDFKLVSGL